MMYTYFTGIYIFAKTALVGEIDTIIGFSALDLRTLKIDVYLSSISDTWIL